MTHEHHCNLCEWMPAEHFPVQDFVREEMEARGWSPLDLALRMGLEESDVTRLLDLGRWGTDYAEALGRAFGTSAQIWQKLWLSDLDWALHEEWARRNQAVPQ